MEFEFNFLADLYHYQEESEPSLLERIRDTRSAIYGRIERHPVTYRFGFYDYLFLGIPALWFYLGSKVLPDELKWILPAVDWPFRLVVSLLLTLLALPFVFLIHFILGKNFDNFIFPFIRKQWCSLIEEKIEETVVAGNSTLCIDCEKLNQHALYFCIPPGLINFIIEELNKVPSITTLSFENLSYDDKGSLLRLAQNVNYIHKLEVSYAFTVCGKRNSNDGFDILSNSKLKIKHLQFKPHPHLVVPFGSANSDQILRFFKQNNALETFQCDSIDLPENLLIDYYNQAMAEEGIQQGCRIITRFQQERFEAMNKTADDINASFPMIKAAFEFFKIMRFSNSLDCNCVDYLCSILLQLCPDGIFEKNKKGFVKFVQAKDRFFSFSTTRPETELLEADQAEAVIEI